MVTFPLLFLLAAFLLAAGLLIAAVIRRALEWGLLGAVLVCWLAAQLFGAVRPA